MARDGPFGSAVVSITAPRGKESKFHLFARYTSLDADRNDCVCRFARVVWLCARAQGHRKSEEAGRAEAVGRVAAAAENESGGDESCRKGIDGQTVHAGRNARALQEW